MKPTLTVLVCLNLSVACCAQAPIDSLRSELREAIARRDSAQIGYCAWYLGYLHHRHKNYDSAISYYRVAYDVIPRPSSSFAAVLNGLGASFSEIGYPDSALQHYHDAHALAIQFNDSTLATSIEANLIITYKDLGLYEDALESGLNLVRKLEGGDAARALASCYSSIAFVYEKTGDIDKAMEYHVQSLNVRKRAGLKRAEALSYTNIGEIYLALNKYDSALANLLRALSIKQSTGDRNGSSSTLNIIGEVLMKGGDLALAAHYLNESLLIKRQFNDRADLAVTLANLAELKLRTNRIREAERYVREAEILARTTGALDNLRRVLEIGIQIHQAKGDAQAALAMSQELLTVRNRLLDEEKDKTIRSLSAKFETEKKEQQIALLEQRNRISQAELEARRITVLALSIGLTLLSIIARLIYHNFKTEARSRRRVELLMKELHHRMKNNLQLLSSIFTLQAQRLSDHRAVEAIKSGESRVNAMALIHRKLYQNDENRNINLNEYITELVEYLVHSYGYTEKNLDLSLKIEPDLDVDVDKAIPVGLILNEIVSNSFKHAYNGDLHPALGISAAMTTKRHLRLEVNDNGQGIPEDKFSGSSHSFGLSMIGLLARQLRGNVEIRGNNGTHFYLNIPISP